MESLLYKIDYLSLKYIYQRIQLFISARCFRHVNFEIALKSGERAK